MFGRLAKILIGSGVLVALAMGFAWGFGQWWALPPDAMGVIYAVYAIATGAMIVLCLAGHLFNVTSQGYYVIIGGAVFLAVDFCVWQRFGIMPSTKFLRSGFFPAGLMGVFLGPLYRAVAMALPLPIQRF